MCFFNFHIVDVSRHVVIPILLFFYNVVAVAHVSRTASLFMIPSLFVDTDAICFVYILDRCRIPNSYYCCIGGALELVCHKYQCVFRNRRIFNYCLDVVFMYYFMQSCFSLLFACDGLYK